MSSIWHIVRVQKNLTIIFIIAVPWIFVVIIVKGISFFLRPNSGHPQTIAKLKP